MLPPSLGSTSGSVRSSAPPACSRRLALPRATGARLRFREFPSGYASMPGGTPHRRPADHTQRRGPVTDDPDHPRHDDREGGHDPAALEAVAQGFRDRSYAGTTAPTAEKPQSKLWFHDGSWWGVLFRPSNAGGGKFTIQRLDLATQTWVDTGVAADRRESVHLDALSDGN